MARPYRRNEGYFSGDKATNEWLDSQKSSTRATYSTQWKYFLEFCGLTGDQILQSRTTDKDYAWEKKVMQFREWIIQQKNKSQKSAATAAGMVRGFFAYHRMPLTFRRQESARLMEAETKYEDYRFSLEDLKKMSDVANLDEKYIMTAGKSFGLRAGDFLKLTRGDLEPYIDREPPISIGEYVTQKEKIKAYPFIDSDALPIIKLMLDKMTREGRVSSSDRILTYTDEIQLSRALRRVADRAGIKYGNKRVRFHNTRKFLIDRLSSHMSESKWKQIVGKKISEGAYVSPESLREDYKRAMYETTFAKLATEGDIEKKIKKETLLTIVKTMGLTENDVKVMFAQRAKRHTIDDEIAVLEDLVSQRKTDGGEYDEQFEQITEEQLLSYLKAGWQVVHRLQSGEIIAKR